MNLIIKFGKTMDNNQAAIFLRASKIGHLLSSNVSEISFNGEQLFINDVDKGRSRVDNLTLSSNEAYDLVKHLSDLGGKAFNNLNPILDLSFGQFRLNAIHDSVANSNNIGVTTFIIRQIYKGLRLKRTSQNLPSPLLKLLTFLLKTHQSIIISGTTGSGKTELQKFLVSLLDSNQRIIMIEDTYETHLKELNPKLDINIWLLNEQEANRGLISQLIKAGLRNNPDWLMLAEARGQETNELLLSVTSGIPIITTIHAQSSLNAIERMIQMMGNSSKFEAGYLAKEIANHIHVYIHLSKTIDNKGKINRQIEEIMICYYEKESIRKKIVYSNNHLINEVELIKIINKISAAGYQP
jgi:pilus assembly protein CpaF